MIFNITAVLFLIFRNNVYAGDLENIKKSTKDATNNQTKTEVIPPLGDTNLTIFDTYVFDLFSTHIFTRVHIFSGM